VFDVVEDPVNSVVHTQAVEQVPRTGLTGSDKLDEQVMDTEEPVETETQAPSSMEGSEVRSFTPPPDSMSSDTYSHSTEQTASQPLQGTENGAGVVPVPSEREREGEGEKEGKGEDEEEVPLQLHSSPVSSTPLVIVVDSLIRGSSL
jgi:hypothetical protein